MELTGNHFSFPWEVSLITWLQSVLPESVIRVFSFLSSFGEEIFLILLIGFLYWGWNKKLGKIIGLPLLLGICWASMVKNIAMRRRPYMDHEGISLFRKIAREADISDIAEQGYSFPSMHSVNSAVVFGALAMTVKKKWAAVLAVLIPLLVGFSRVVVGAHFPTDVMTGWLLGFASLFVTSFLQKKIKSTPLFYLVVLLLTLPGIFFCKSADYFSGFGMMIGFLLGTLLEEKVVRFENTRNPLRILLRILGGIGVFLALNSLLKLPFSADFLESSTLPSYMVRCARYALIIFADFGVYPLLFRCTARIKWLGKA